VIPIVHNTSGYTIRKEKGKRVWWWPLSRETIYHVTMDGAKPLTWQDADGNEWRTVRHDYHSDLGSVPWFAAPLGITKDSALMSYLLHDEAYMRGHVMLRRDGNAWLPVEVTREWADEQLRAGAIAEGNFAWQARAIWWAVRRFGGSAWK
jgi:hypothetical protein